MKIILDMMISLSNIINMFSIKTTKN